MDQRRKPAYVPRARILIAAMVDVILGVVFAVTGLIAATDANGVQRLAGVCGMIMLVAGVVLLWREVAARRAQGSSA